MHVDYCGEISVVSADGLTLGAAADVVLDSNPELDPVVAHLERRDAVWWLVNRSDAIGLEVGDGRGLRAAMEPGARFPIVAATLRVEFRAGPTTYDFDIIAEEVGVAPVTRIDAGGERAGTLHERVAFTPSQRLLLVALCESRLRGERGQRIPPSWELAERLGWTVTAFNRKLDSICEKLDRLGVSGLRGARGMHAGDRRRRLAEFAVEHDLVTDADLDLLPGAESRSADEPLRAAR